MFPTTAARGRSIPSPKLPRLTIRRKRGYCCCCFCRCCAAVVCCWCRCRPLNLIRTSRSRDWRGRSVERKVTAVVLPCDCRLGFFLFAFFVATILFPRLNEILRKTGSAAYVNFAMFKAVLYVHIYRLRRNESSSLNLRDFLRKMMNKLIGFIKWFILLQNKSTVFSR